MQHHRSGACNHCSQGITAVAASPSGSDRRAPTLLALAVKAARRTARVLVFQLVPGSPAMGTTAKQLGQADLATALPIQVPSQLLPVMLICKPHGRKAGRSSCLEHSDTELSTVDHRRHSAMRCKAFCTVQCHAGNGMAGTATGGVHLAGVFAAGCGSRRLDAAVLAARGGAAADTHTAAAGWRAPRHPAHGEEGSYECMTQNHCNCCASLGRSPR